MGFPVGHEPVRRSLSQTISVRLCQLDVNLDIPRTPTEEVPPLQWPIGHITGHFLDCLLMSKGPNHCGQCHAWASGPVLSKAGDTSQ